MLKNKFQLLIFQSNGCLEFFFLIFEFEIKSIHALNSTVCLLGLTTLQLFFSRFVVPHTNVCVLALLSPK